MKKVLLILMIALFTVSCATEKEPVKLDKAELTAEASNVVLVGGHDSCCKEKQNSSGSTYWSCCRGCTAEEQKVNSRALNQALNTPNDLALNTSSNIAIPANCSSCADGATWRTCYDSNGQSYTEKCPALPPSPDKEQ